MAKHNLTQAAKLANISRSTLMRHIKEGKITREIGDDGKPCIDTSEVMRVYDVGQSHRDTDTVSMDSHETPKKDSRDSQLRDEVQALRQEKIEFLEKSLRDLQEERDNWRKEAEDWKKQAQNLLSDQNRTVEKKTVKGRRFWYRLFS